MEELSSQSDVDGVVFCDKLLYLLDGINTTTDNPTNTKIRPTSKKKKKHVTPPIKRFPTKTRSPTRSPTKTRNPPKSRNPPKTTTNSNSNNTNKMKTKKATPPTTKSPPTTRTNPPTMLAEMLTDVFSTITKYTDDDTAEYVSETLLANPCDDDTRESVREIIKEAKTPKFAAVICDCLFAIVDAIENKRKRQQKRDLKPTADRQQSKNSTGKDTTRETETNNNNNNNNNETNDNPVKADGNHIPRPSDYLLEQQKVAAEVEQWEKQRMEESESQRQLKRQQLECERRQVESDRQSRQQKEQRRAHQQHQPRMQSMQQLT